MTLENCKKYLAEAKDKETRKFWSDRIDRKYPSKPIEKPLKKEKKEVKE